MSLLHVGTYNVEYGHAPAAHARMILEQFDRCTLDVLAMQEVQDYVTQLRIQTEKTGHQLIVSKRGHVAFLIRKSIPIGKHWDFRAATWYRSTDGHPMAPCRPLAVQIAGTLFLNVHAPVHAWIATPHGHTFTGPTLRRIAYQTFVLRILLFLTRHKGKPTCILGDWNATPPPNTTGVYAPERIRAAYNGRYARPWTSTGHGEIDYGIVHGRTTSIVRVRPDIPNAPKSDHRLVTWRLDNGPQRTP